MLPVAMTPYRGIVIRYVLPVLWFTYNGQAYKKATRKGHKLLVYGTSPLKLENIYQTNMTFEYLQR